MSLERFRARLPLVAFILLLLICLLMLGIACACFSDHPMQALERALAFIPASPALVEIWFVSLLAIGAAALVASTQKRARAPSPAVLQRFLL
jgi:hypothetical protein